MIILTDKLQLKTLTPKAGIYAFRNKINNKYYIGQSLSIRQRINAHINTFNNHTKQLYPIYKAFNKYGLNNFEVLILYVMDNKNCDKNIIKQELDIQETKYIKLFNSYGCTGYNQTLGGDGGILGYKFSNEQKQKQRINTIKQVNDRRYKIFVYDILTKSKQIYNSLSELNNKLHTNIGRSSIRNLVCNEQFIISRTEEQLNIKIAKYNNNAWINGKSKKLPEDFKDFYMTHTIAETQNYFNISIPTLYKWCKILDIRKR